MSLEEADEILSRQAAELRIEGINPYDYWAKKIGITRDELTDFAEERTRETFDNYKNELSLGQIGTALWLEGLVFGITLRRKRKE